MLYDYIKKNYIEAEPIFFSDLEREDISKSALNQQLRKLCEGQAHFILGRIVSRR